MNVSIVNRAVKQVFAAANKTNTRFLVFIVFTPVFWWGVVHMYIIATEWAKTPRYVENKVQSIFEQQRLKYVEELRWANVQAHNNELFSRIFYNKATILLDEIVSLTTFLSPRFYFQAGDGGKLSPPGTEPVPIILFPFWIFGLLTLVKRQGFRPILLSLILGGIAYLAGQKTLSFLFPVLLVYLYIVNVGIGEVRNEKLRFAVMSFIVLYSAYIIGRALWLPS